MLPHQGFKNWHYSQKMRYANRTIFHAQHMLAWSMKKKSLIVSATNYDYWRTLVRDHKWLLKYGLELKHKLQLSVTPARPGHYSGWYCITHGAYPRAPHEGNGYNGLYSGPLGMTTPWMGYYPPGLDWVHTNVNTVYAIAERVASRYGWSYSFMSGQWPETFPPCARYF